ncbi:MAG: GrpB family protein [Planctomycetaceae bacterium]|nr:MAG: GrpB family protein [Planctomycetaceae bacterium]
MSIRLMHYDPRWPQEFEQTKSGILHSCLGDVVDVQHIGSTAISGLIAQPIVDVMAAVTDDATIESVAALIEGLYFRVVPSPAWAADSLWLAKPRHGEITHRVVLTRLGSPLWCRVLAVRDFFRQNPERAIRFEEVKVRLWKSGEGQVDQYARDMALFYSHLEEQLGLAL